MALLLALAVAWCPSAESCQWAYGLCIEQGQAEVQRAAEDGRCAGAGCRRLYDRVKARCIESYLSCLRCP